MLFFRNFQLAAAVNQGNRTFKIWKSETRQKSFGFMKVRMYEFEERRKGEVSKLRILQLAGKVDLRWKANISGVCWRIRPESSEKKISIGKVMSGYAVLKSQANRSRTVQKNGSFLVNRRSYWAEIPGDGSRPLLYPGKIFFSEHFYQWLLSFRERCFLAFSLSKNGKSPNFLGSFKSYERKLFCVKISKRSDDFWPFSITRDFWGTFGTFWPFLAKNGYFLSKDRSIHECTNESKAKQPKIGGFERKSESAPKVGSNKKSAILVRSGWDFNRT